MLLFQKRFWPGLQSGAITLTFRQWATSRVKPGGRYRVHPIGVVQVDDVRQVRVGEITDEDARSAGFSGLAELRAYMEEISGGKLRESTQVFRVRLHHGGDGDRISTALETTLTDEDLEALVQKLRRMDERSPTGPWTRKTLALIQKNPQIAASKLAPKLELETLPFKANVVKLKKLGLTQSFEVGYEISPRGQEFLKRRKRW